MESDRAAMSYLGDFRLGDTFDTAFCTVQATGAPTTLSGSPVISAYVGNSTTELTAGITLSVDFDARTGLNHVRVVATSGNGYATASNYQLVITTGTVNSISAVGYVIGEFSIENRSALMPTVEGRTLGVAATGQAGIDWANVAGQGTTVSLTSTTVAVVTGVATVTNLTNAASAGDLTSTMKTSVATAALTTAMTESYVANGSAPTLAQAMFLTMQRLTEFAISGTTITIKKIDHSTTAATLTINDATSPTSSTRAT
jgi:hypothetical protein